MPAGDVFDAAARAFVAAVGVDVMINLSPIRAVLAEGWTQVASGDVRVSSRRPRIYVRFAELPANACAAEDPRREGDEVEIGGRCFQVVDVRPDVENVGATLVLKAPKGE